jgi:tryptophanase
MLPHIPQSEFPGQSLVVELYRTGGIRAVEIGSVMFGSADPETFAKFELVRLAIPRRVYTKSHVDYVVDCFEDINRRRSEIRGVRITEQPERLRHFTARFEMA